MILLIVMVISVSLVFPKPLEISTEWDDKFVKDIQHNYLLIQDRSNESPEKSQNELNNEKFYNAQFVGRTSICATKEYMQVVSNRIPATVKTVRLANPTAAVKQNCRKITRTVTYLISAGTHPKTGQKVYSLVSEERIVGYGAYK